MSVFKESDQGQERKGITEGGLYENEKVNCGQRTQTGKIVEM